MYRLVVTHGTEVRTFPVPEEQARLGAAPDNNLILNFPGISRHHALVRRCPGGVEVIDQGSKNGLIVEGQRMTRTVLTPGLQVQVGAAWLELQEVSTLSTGSTPPPSRSAPFKPTAPGPTATRGAEASDRRLLGYGDALRLAYHLDRVGAGNPGQRRELLVRFRAVLGSEVLLTCERQRREEVLVIREKDGSPLSEENERLLSLLIATARSWSQDEVRLKHSGDFLLAGRGDRFLVAKFSDQSSVHEGWRQDFLRFLAERLLSAPLAIDDTKAAAIRHTLSMTGGNKSETARLLKVSRQTIYNFLKRPS